MGEFTEGDFDYELAPEKLHEAIDRLVYPIGGIENGAVIVASELHQLADAIYIARNAPSGQKIITFEGAARSGKTNILLMLQKVFNEVGLNTKFIDLHPINREKQGEEILKRIDINKTKILFFDEVMLLDGSVLAEIRRLFPELIIVLTMAYNVKTVDVSFIAQKWLELNIPDSSEFTKKIIMNSFWNRTQVREFVKQARRSYEKRSQWRRNDSIDRLDESEWQYLADVCSVVSFGHPQLLNTLVSDIMLGTPWEEIFDNFGKTEIKRVGRCLLKYMQIEINKLASSTTDDGKVLLRSVGAESDDQDPQLSKFLSGDAKGLRGNLDNIISPQAYQHLASQMLTKMAEIATFALED